MSKVFGVTGWKNSGKTTLTERLIGELTRRGYRVASLKHAHHAFDIDREGTDSWRHRAAGASEVAIVSSGRWALIGELRGAPEPTMEEVLAKLGPCDVVIVEGYKRESHPKIECRRSGGRKGEPLAPSDPHIVAVASDHETDTAGLPHFGLDDIPAIADFVVARLALPRSERAEIDA
ncbi:molybdopterin-guanine dinucleotide biosynthesis protein B [Lutibaculum baratangense]|uniref:Molybdopterin-guanine dinucleotide biosynthesis protein MobB n=1 Tax=Lutibaculum baratangense AMV1 TaxID=631454 RepID=V4TLS5_9HYPH|nr:molybdopterin-guanine dinucleotide biosynthesis protein B [Lutibaculum baratangense]ESR26743.1 Molybdopterin-guanine dinucleotide biosynthesis protein MobB [Lutibaculum baratangense AMV1]